MAVRGGKRGDDLLVNLAKRVVICQRVCQDPVTVCEFSAVGVPMDQLQQVPLVTVERFDDFAQRFRDRLRERRECLLLLTREFVQVRSGGRRPSRRETPSCPH